jgi:CarboxypepD_reg-like domain
LRLFFLFILLSVSAITVYAQKTYRGIVVDSATLIGVPNVLVTFTKTQKGVYTSANGSFAIQATSFDTLVFSMLGYKTIELPLFMEEDALLIRVSENVRMLSEITVKATRLYPNEIANRTRQAPRKMAAYQALQSPFTYFSKTEKEKRKIYRYVEETNKTQTYVQVITDPIVREIFMKDYSLTDEEYYELLARFNQIYKSIQYATNPEDIMEALHSYFEGVK